MSTKTAAKKKAPAKKYDAQKAKVWGSPDYLVMKFDDVQEVAEMSRFCADVRKAKAVVKSISTPDDNLAVYRTYCAKTCIPGEEPKDVTIVHVSMGLNGPGDQSKYFAALNKLTATGAFHVIDAFVDAIDDLFDVICVYTRPDEKARPSKAGKGGAA